MATSALNPNAPIFVPLAYRTVEDFSDQWWDLVHSSPWFRDYWLQECFRDPQNDPPLNDFFDSALPDIDFLFDDNITQNSSIATNIQQEGGRMDLVSLGLLEWGKPRGTVEMTKYGEKAPKTVKVRVNPRPIKQPR